MRGIGSRQTIQKIAAGHVIHQIRSFDLIPDNLTPLNPHERFE